MNILFFGTANVSLVSGTCLEVLGYSVTCMDVDLVKVEKLKTGILLFAECSLMVKE